MANRMEGCSLPAHCAKCNSPVVFDEAKLYRMDPEDEDNERTQFGRCLMRALGGCSCRGVRWFLEFEINPGGVECRLDRDGDDDA